MTKTTTLTVRLNPEKIIDKNIIDYLEDHPTLSRAKFIRLALQNQINFENGEQNKVKPKSTSTGKKKITKDFNAKVFSNKDF